MTSRTTVRDLMTSPAISVRQGDTYKAIVDRLAAHRISAVPVVDGNDQVLGVVSESDLLSKVELSEEPLEARLLERPGHRRARVKAASDRANQLMTAPAVTVRPDESVVAAAKRMQHEKVKRLPVVDEHGRLVGIVSRADLLRVFLRTDEEIRDEVVSEVMRRVLLIAPPEIVVEVHDGVVTLVGQLERKSLIPIAVQLTRAVDGAVGVVDRLTYAVDDADIDRPFAFGPPM